MLLTLIVASQHSFISTTNTRVRSCLTNSGTSTFTAADTDVVDDDDSRGAVVLLGDTVFTTVLSSNNGCAFGKGTRVFILIQRSDNKIEH